MEKKKISDNIYDDISNLKFNKSKILKEQLNSLKERENLNRKMKFSLFATIFLATLFTMLILILSFFKKAGISSLLNSDEFILIPTVFLLISILISLLDKNLVFDKMKETSDELEYLNIENESDIKKAEKQFKLHQNELQKYYSQNLSHSQKIFYTGIVCIVLGFGIIVFTMWILSTKNINNTLELMITGGIGGVLSNFIGVIYLKMYSETLKVLIEFHNKLVYTHNLHFSNYLLAKVENKELKEKILQEAILAIVKKEKLD